MNPDLTQGGCGNRKNGNRKATLLAVEQDGDRVIAFREYARDPHPYFHVVSADGQDRFLPSANVPPYVLGIRDGYAAVLANLTEALRDALNDPGSVDDASTAALVERELHRRIGQPVASASSYIADDHASMTTRPQRKALEETAAA